MRLNFFFDIDGTILPIGKAIPESAEAALLKAKEKGHRIFLCSGRNTYELPQSFQRIPFDGGVFAAGAKVVFGDKIIDSHYVSEEQKAAFFRIARKYDLVWMVQGPSCTYMSKPSHEFYSKIYKEFHGRTINIPGLRIVDEFPADEPMVKFCTLSRSLEMLSARKELDQYFQTVNDPTQLPLELSCEGGIPGLTKASGINSLLAYLGEGIESTVGIGDGDNDKEMVQLCRLGIAMGNADEKLKKVADYVTADIMENGLAKAIEYAMGVLG